MNKSINIDKVIKRTIGIIIGICMILIMLISSVEIAAYSSYGFYEKEYTKYDVNNKNGIVNMEMDELIRVTKEMMSYLRGDREDLVIMATIDGVEKEMFNNVEKYHMADVRELFIKGLEIRRVSIAIAIVGIIILAMMYGAKRALYTALLNCKRVIFAIWAFGVIIASAALVDFTTVFTVFHMIFFDNDGWILDVSISRLINILPEGFFVDMALRIVVIYLFLNLIILAFAFYSKCARIKAVKFKTLRGGTYEQG